MEFYENRIVLKSLPNLFELERDWLKNNTVRVMDNGKELESMKILMKNVGVEMEKRRERFLWKTSYTIEWV